MYAAFILDVYSRMVVGWEISNGLRFELAIDALELARLEPYPGRSSTGYIDWFDHRCLHGEITDNNTHLTPAEAEALYYQPDRPEAVTR